MNCQQHSRDEFVIMLLANALLLLLLVSDTHCCVCGGQLGGVGEHIYADFAGGGGGGNSGAWDLQCRVRQDHQGGLVMELVFVVKAFWELLGRSYPLTKHCAVCVPLNPACVCLPPLHLSTAHPQTRNLPDQCGLRYEMHTQGRSVTKYVALCRLWRNSKPLCLPALQPALLTNSIQPIKR